MWAEQFDNPLTECLEEALVKLGEIKNKLPKTGWPDWAQNFYDGWDWLWTCIDSDILYSLKCARRILANLPSELIEVEKQEEERHRMMKEERHRLLWLDETAG